MFSKKKNFLFYLPQLHGFYIIKAKDECSAVSRLLNHFCGSANMVDDYDLIKEVHTLEKQSLFERLKNLWLNLQV